MQFCGVSVSLLKYTSSVCLAFIFCPKYSSYLGVLSNTKFMYTVVKWGHTEGILREKNFVWKIYYIYEIWNHKKNSKLVKKSTKDITTSK